MVNTVGPVHFTDIIGFQPFTRRRGGDIRTFSRSEFVGLQEEAIQKYVTYVLSLDGNIEDLPITELQVECANLHHPLLLLEDPEKREKAHNFLFSLESPEDVKRGLRVYFVDFLGSDTLLAEDNHHRGLFFFNTLDKIIDHVASEYAKIDTEKPRNDGSTHFSHAWGVTRLLLESIGYHSKEAIFAALLHDYLEDASGSRKEKIRRIRRLLDPVSKFVKIDKVIDIILELTKKELSEHLDPKARLQIFLGFKNEDEIIKGERKDELKNIRNAEYIKGLKDVKLLPTFLIKLADRLHSLTHFDGNDLEFVSRKVAETYAIMEATKERGAWEKDSNIRLMYGHALEMIREQVIRIKKTLLQTPEGLYDSRIERELYPEPLSIEKPLYYIEKKNPNFWKRVRDYRVRVSSLVQNGGLASA